MKIAFQKNKPWRDAFHVANCYRWESVPDFIEEENCIVNRKSDGIATGFENASLMLKSPFTGDTHISVDCAFEAWGAPLIVIAESLEQDGQGRYRYREYYEVVLYEEGINVWRLTTDRQNNVSWKKIMSVDFPVAPKEVHTLTVDIVDDTLQITACGRKMFVALPELSSRYYVGIDACENINRFYGMTVEPIRKKEGDTFVCSFCGYRHTGDAPPEKCPDCGVGPEKFEIL